MTMLNDYREQEKLAQACARPLLLSTVCGAQAERGIRSSTKHIEKLDCEGVVQFWQEHHDENTCETGRALLPLVQVYSLKPVQECDREYAAGAVSNQNHGHRHGTDAGEYGQRCFHTAVGMAHTGR